MPQNIGDNRVIEDGIARITADDAERLSRYLVRTGDIVYSRRGDVEKRALIRSSEDGWLCGTGCLRVRFGGHGEDPSYASYYLGHPEVRAWIVRHAQGATMPNLNTSILSSLPFVVPPIEEQRAIAHILGTLDDKIELNRRMNETLEEMVQAIFKSWFVDFDPVRAKAEGRDPGLPQHIADLFPDRFEDSELGVMRWLSTVDDEDLYLSVLVIGEIRQGIEGLRRRDPLQAGRLEVWLAGLRRDYAGRILPVDMEVAEEWGRMNAPDPISSRDGLMAATAKVRGMTFVTRNTADVERTGVALLNPFSSNGAS